MLPQKMKYTFSGHESFQCKSLWLKKGYDYVVDGRSFNDDYAVVALGVGKNMVSSIRFWLKAFGIMDDNSELSVIGRFIFDNEDGIDPYIEDVNTQWLLHYLLVNTQYATIYNVFFEDFCRTRHEFSKEQFLAYIRRLFNDKSFGNIPYNENTISRDISTLLKNYVRPQVTKNFDDFYAVLLDLNLIKLNGDQYAINHAGKAKLHPMLFLFAILDQYPADNVIEYQKLLDVANIFCLSQNELYEIFDWLHSYNSNIYFSNTAGEQLFTINESIDKWSILKEYYNNN